LMAWVECDCGGVRCGGGGVGSENKINRRKREEEEEGATDYGRKQGSELDKERE